MILYTGLPQEDLLIAQWYAFMADMKEIESTFSESLLPLGAFMGYFRGAGRSLIYDVDKTGFYAAWWFEESLDGVMSGFWLRRDYRRKHQGRQAALDGLDIALKRWPVVIGITREALLRTHKQLGYTVVGSVPLIKNGESMWIVCITRAMYDDARAIDQACREARWWKGEGPSRNSEGLLQYEGVTWG